MVIAGVADANQGGQIANIMFMLNLIFCGILVGPSSLLRF